MLANFLFATFRTQLFCTFWSDRKGRTLDRRSASAKTQSSRKPKTSTPRPQPLSLLYTLSANAKRCVTPFSLSILIFVKRSGGISFGEHLPKGWMNLGRIDLIFWRRIQKYECEKKGFATRDLSLTIDSLTKANFAIFFNFGWHFVWVFWVIVSIPKIILNSIWNS